MQKTVHSAALHISLVLFLLAGCATNETSQAGRYELLSLTVLPKGNELKDECTCLNEDIVALNAFAEKMNNSRSAVHYQAMSHQKIAVIQDRADTISCKYPAFQ